MNKANIDIVLPCYNPDVKDWYLDIVKNVGALERLFPNCRFFVILINDGSIKGIENEHIDYLTAQLPSFQYISYTQNQGKGYALREGMKVALHDWQIYTDVDFPFELMCMKGMIEKLLTGKDIVLGERQFSYANQLRNYRKILSSGSHIFNSIILNLPFTDTQGGLKGFSKAGKTVFLKTEINRYLFDTEFILRACKQKNLAIATVPLTLREGVVLSQMGLSIVKKEFGSLLKLIKIRFFG